MKANEIEKLILEQHKAKFPKATWQTQILKVAEEKNEAKQEINRSEQNWLIEIFDVAITCIGLQRFSETKLIGEDLLWDCFQKTNLEFDTFYNKVLSRWEEINKRIYFEKNGEYHHWL